MRGLDARVVRLIVESPATSMALLIQLPVRVRGCTWNAHVRVAVSGEEGKLVVGRGKKASPPLLLVLP